MLLHAVEFDGQIVLSCSSSRVRKPWLHSNFQIKNVFVLSVVHDGLIELLQFHDGMGCSTDMVWPLDQASFLLPGIILL